MLARAQMLWVADMHGGAEASGCLPDAARQHYQECQQRALQVGAELVQDTCAASIGEWSHRAGHGRCWGV